MPAGFYKRIKKEIRKCCICKEIKSIIDFEKNKSKPQGYSYRCKKCDTARNRIKNKNRRLRLRFEILEKFNFTCQYCGRKAPKVELQIDHIYPKSKGGLDKKENYQVLCVDCNIGKSDCILQEFTINK